MKSNYIVSVRKQFEYYKSLGEKSFQQIEDDELFWHYHKNSNSIGIIVNHLAGNMRSRWTDFLTTDGEKEWRGRDKEFESVIETREEMLHAWETGWSCLFAALESLSEKQLNADIAIRNQTHTVVEAINRQMMHYAYHVGQIVYIARMVSGDNWKSLSIPKGGSKAFNDRKFD